MQIKNIELKTYAWCIIGVLLGFYLAGSFESIKIFVFSLFGGFNALLFTAGITSEILKEGFREVYKPKREVAYVLSVFVLFGTCWFFTSLLTGAVEPGDEDGLGNVAIDYKPGKQCKEVRAMYLSVFTALLAPTLIGVRSALGKPK